MQRVIAKIIRNSGLEHDMRGLPPDFWYYFKEEIRGLNWTVQVGFLTIITIIVIAVATLISPIYLVFLFVLLYPIPYCLYQAYQRCKPIDEPLIRRL